MTETITNTNEYDGSTPLKGRRERFSQLMATDDENHSECYRQAKYKAKNADRAAYQLLSSIEVQKRINYLRAEFAEKMQITREGQAQKLAIARARAIEQGDITNEIAAIKEENKLYGLITDKVIHEETTELSKERIEEAKTLAKQAAESERLRLVRTG